ncbi:unnamed protein product, partial [Brenthis ino]
MLIYEPIGITATLAVCTTILQFLSGIIVCKQYVDNKTTAESSPLPFFCGFASSGVWLLYGMAKQDNKIVFVNAVGVILMASYVIVFYLYTFKKSSVLRLILLTLVFYGFIMGYMSVELDNEVLVNRFGLLACFLTLLTIAAPMSKLIYVIKTKSTDCLPFPMIFMSFIVSSLWYIYGMMAGDSYIMVPNLVGGGLSFLQLSLFVIYPSVPQQQLIPKSVLA